MNTKESFTITERDRLLRAWEDSVELTRNYQAYADEMKDKKKLYALFHEYAEDEAYHASKLVELLNEYEPEH